TRAFRNLDGALHGAEHFTEPRPGYGSPHRLRGLHLVCGDRFDPGAILRLPGIVDGVGLATKRFLLARLLILSGDLVLALDDHDRLFGPASIDRLRLPGVIDGDIGLR